MYTGDLQDNRKPKDQLKDFSSEEVDLGIKYVSPATAKKNADKYIERNQFSTSSCVPSSICNALWNTEKVDLAQEPNYRQRSNFPEEGCYWVDQLDLAVNYGMNKRDEVKEVKTEKEANNFVITDDLKELAKVHKQKSYVFNTGFDDIIRALNNDYPVVFSIGSNSKEYANAKPKVIGGTFTIYHAICGIPNTGTKDSFWITDSSHFGKVVKREITREFYEARKRFWGAYFIDLDYEEKPEWVIPDGYKGSTFNRDLTVGMRGSDVVALQDILKANGLFPKNIGSTGYFGGITRQAVKDFQKKYEKSVLWVLGLKTPTGYFGRSSRAKLTELIA